MASTLPRPVDDVATLDVGDDRPRHLAVGNALQLGRDADLPIGKPKAERAGADSHHEQEQDQPQAAVRPTEHRSARD